MYGFELIFGKWTIDKDPEAELSYGIDWTPWLAPGDSVASVIWTVAGTLVNVTSQLVGNVTYIRLRAGTLGEAPMPSARGKITTTLSAEIQPQTLYFNMVTQ